MMATRAISTVSSLHDLHVWSLGRRCLRPSRDGAEHRWQMGRLCSGFQRRSILESLGKWKAAGVHQVGFLYQSHAKATKPGFLKEKDQSEPSECI